MNQEIMALSGIRDSGGIEILAGTIMNIFVNSSLETDLSLAAFRIS
jgi:hypothetical protein